MTRRQAVFGRLQRRYGAFASEPAESGSEPLGTCRYCVAPGQYKVEDVVTCEGHVELAIHDLFAHDYTPI